MLNAGTNQSITFPATATLSGNATDDGLPAGSSIHLSWSKISGPGTVSFNPADGTGTNLASTATFSAPGAYVLNFTGDDGDRTNSSSVVVVVNASPEIQDIVWCEDSLPYGAIAYAEPEPWCWISSNPPPYAGIKAHQSSIYSGLHQHYFGGALPPISLQASNLLYAYVYIDPANPPLEVMLQWHATDTTGWYDHRAYWSAGPNYMWAGVRVGDLPAAGTWTRLEIDAGSVGLSGRDIDGVAFTLYGGRATWDHAGVVKFATNNVPTVTAGADIGVSISEAATLQGFASDDGLPSLPGLAATWSQISGPGTATFGNLHATNTTVTFDVAGDYVLRLIADDSELSTFDEVNVTVHHAFANDPVAWWQFNDATGIAALDSSGYGHNGMIVGTPNRIVGKVGNALQFDGADDWVTIPDAADLHLVGDMSLALWVNPARLETNAWILLAGKGDSSSSAREFDLWIEPGTCRLVFKQGDNTGQQINLYSSQALPLNQWTHVLVTVQGNVVRLFLNGSLDATGTRVGAPLATSWPVTLGHRNNYAYFQGAMDEVRLYGRAISNFEIQTLSTLDVPADNYPPTLSDISNQITSAGSPCGPISFTINDDFTLPQSLGIAVVSGTPALVPNTVSNLVLGGSSGVRTLTVYPASDQSGTASINVTVNDGFTAVSKSFTITYLPALRLSLRADVGITNASVDRWRDQTTNHFDIIQATAAYQPQWVTNAVNGLPAVRFDGVNDVMTSSNLLTGVTNAEAFIVLKAASATPSSSQGLWRVGRDTYTYYPEPSGQLQDGFASTTLHLIGKPAQAVDQFHVYNVASQNGLWQARINGVLQASDAVNSFGVASTFNLGWNYNSFAGDVAEVLFFSRVLSDAERDAVNQYLNSRFGWVATVPLVPANLRAQGISTNQVSLAWNFSLGTASTRFVIERKESTATGFSQVAMVRDALGYLDSGLAAASSYNYRIKAINDSGESAYTSEITASTFSSGTAVPLSNLKLWLRADCGAAGTGTNRFLSRWLDQSGNGSHAVQNTLANSPKWIANATNGMPAVHFDGVNDSLSIPNMLSGVTNVEVIAVLKAATGSPSSYQGLWRFGSMGYAYYPEPSGQIQDSFASTTMHMVGKPVQTVNQFHGYDVSSGNGLWQARINGVLQTSDTNNTFSTSSTLYLGNAGSYYFTGDIAEILVFNRLLSDEEREAVGLYVNSRYGLVSALPASPSHLLAQGVSTNQVSLTWDFDLNATATRFVIERKDAASTSFHWVATVRDALGYLDTGLVAASGYNYRIKAVNDAGESAYTPAITVFTSTNGLAIPMANLKLWLRADSGTAGAGTNRFLNRWLDQSGNGNHANQNTLAYAPLWVANATNGRPAIRFDGVNDSLSIPNVLSGATHAEVFVVLKVATRYPTAGKALWRYGASSTYTYYPDTGGAIKDDFASSTLHNVGVPTQPLDQFHIYDAVSAAGLWQARINGVLQRNDTNNVFSVLSTFNLGSSYSYFAGDVAEVMVFNRQLADGERLATQMFLAGKYLVDSDGDGLSDGWEWSNFGDLSHVASEDYDADGLTNLQECQLGTDPKNPDSDGDLLSDGAEVFNYGSDPRNAYSLAQSGQFPSLSQFASLDEMVVASTDVSAMSTSSMAKDGAVLSTANSAAGVTPVRLQISLTTNASTLELTLVGAGQFYRGDFKDLSGFVARLAAGTNADLVSQMIRSNLSAAALTEVSNILSATNITRGAAARSNFLNYVAVDLNELVQGGASLFDSSLFSGITLRPATQNLLNRAPTGEELILLNRLVLEDAYPQEMVKTVYDIYRSESLTGGNWLPYAWGEYGQNAFTATISGVSAAFRAGSAFDRDQDGLPDGYEQLVTNTYIDIPDNCTFDSNGNGKPDWLDYLGDFNQNGAADWDGDGIENSRDANPRNENLGPLSITIDNPANGVHLQ